MWRVSIYDKAIDIWQFLICSERGQLSPLDVLPEAAVGGVYEIRKRAENDDNLHHSIHTPLCFEVAQTDECFIV